jgi:Cu/Ag efflux protein CusF
VASIAPSSWAFSQHAASILVLRSDYFSTAAVCRIQVPPKEHALPPIGILTACFLAAVTGSATAVMLVRPALTLTDPLCSAPALGRTETGFGRVVVIDLHKRHLTIDHQELKRVAMPAMNMMFAVHARAPMAQLRPGDMIHFTIDRSDMSIVNIVVVKRAD